MDKGINIQGMKTPGVKIHISFDSCSQEEILSHAKLLEPYYTHIHLGTAPLFRHGIDLIRTLRQEVSQKKIILKLKLADYVKEHTQIFSPLGIHSLSVIPGITRTMLHAAAVVLHNQNMNIILEMFDISYVNQTISDANAALVDAILFHHIETENQETQQTLLEQVDFIRENTNLPIYLDTSITLDNIQEVVNTRPDAIVLKEEIILEKDLEKILQQIQTVLR